ncbi:MAG: RICIN domain-containing protein, partial [Clostridia bacterium]|nr:RICIN domain-containing protein [Clostridia bacterium]
EVTVPQPVTYGSISGSTTVVAGVDYTYTASKAGVAADVTWSVSDNDVAEITNEGVLTAKTGGTVTLTATFADATSTALTIKVLAANQTIRIVNKNSGKGLETKSKGITSGTPLVQWENRDLDTAAWKLSPTADGKFNIINANANMLLVNDNGLKISNTVAATDDNAKWELKNHGGYYEIYNIGTQKSLNVSGQSTANGGNVILYTYAGGDNELWSFEAAAETLEHVVPVPVDYSAKYSGTNFTYVSNVESATNDFNDNDLKGFALTGDAALGSDSDGEAVLLPQSKLNNGANRNNSGTATLNLTTPITCEDNQLINLSFDMHTPISNGNSTFKLSSSDETELVDVSVTSWADVYSVTISGDEVENSGNGAVYFRNNQSNKDNSTHVSRGGHVEVYYKPSTGAIRVTVKNVTNSSALQTYTGVVDAGKDIKKIYFEGVYTSYNKPLVVDNLVTNIVTYSGTEFDNVERPQETTAPVLPASGELINMNFNDSTLASTSTYGKATGSPKFVTVDDKQCIQFDGTSATVVTLTDANGNSLLTGQKNLTISFKVKPAGTGTSWWLYAAPNNNAQAGGSETYLGVLEQNTKLTLERYKSGRSDCANKDGVLTLNEWHDVLISIADNVTSIYVDGVQAGSAASNVDISDMLGSKSVAYIGKANWGNGEYATGYIDDFVIYNYAFDTALASLDLGDTSAVTDDLTLPAKVGDTNITWATSDAEVVTNTGVVTRADETKTATLTASAVVNGITLTKTFDITVTGKTAV